MLKKLIFLLCYTPSALYAEVCPTLPEIQAGTFASRGWHALNLNSGEPLSPSKWQFYKQKIKHFYMAKWVPDAPEGSGQCFYINDHDVYELDVYFTKNNLLPDKARGNWRPVDYNNMQCSGNHLQLTACHFKSSMN